MNKKYKNSHPIDGIDRIIWIWEEEIHCLYENYNIPEDLLYPEILFQLEEVYVL